MPRIIFDAGHNLNTRDPIDDVERDNVSGNGRICNERGPTNRWVCTRHDGHDGDHVAHGYLSRVLMRWASRPRRCPRGRYYGHGG